jgi:hypothetical protein
MTFSGRRLLFWAPRVVSILFIAFLGLFALDVFNEGYGFPRVLLALAMHLTPSLLLALVLAVAWRWEWFGAVCYAAAGVWYVSTVLPRALPAAVKANWIGVIAMPAFIIAGLFLFGWIRRADLRNPA